MNDNDTSPYISRNAGDLWTAEDWNEVQILIKEDIGAQTQAAIEGIETVPHADETDKLGGKTLEELTQEIIDKALSQIPKRTGYLQLFKRLRVGEEVLVDHGLKAFPLLDLYQLDYFRVVASEDDQQFITWVNFYLYHASEKRIRFRDPSTNTTESIEIEPADGRAYRIPFTEMLDYYQIDYTDNSSIVDLETEFWDAISAAPNDAFDDDQHTHSPWFDRCCREERTVKSLKQRRDWDDLMFQMRPRKTLNYPYTNAVIDDDGNVTVSDGQPVAPAEGEPMPAPSQIEVVQFDFNTLGLKLLRESIYPPELFGEEGLEDHRVEQVRQELKVMLLLKV